MDPGGLVRCYRPSFPYPLDSCSSLFVMLQALELPRVPKAEVFHRDQNMAYVSPFYNNNPRRVFCPLLPHLIFITLSRPVAVYLSC